MNRLEFNKVRFRNFLSYGAKWQEVEFKKGLNLVIGKDKDTGKSNGSGKSSLLETISFALFGSIHTDVKQVEIINWKNRKGTEVELFFTKGSNTYKVCRTLKPNSLKIYKNEELINPPSHVKYYQEQLEEILGFNKQTFSKIIHSNINSSNPILSMKKAEKRNFMEKIFGLGIYSKLNALGNEKLKYLKDQIREFELQMDSNNSSITNLEDMNRNLNFKISEIDKDNSDEKILNKLEVDLKMFKKVNVSKVEYKALKKEYDKDVVERDEKDKLLNELHVKVDMLNKQISSLENILKTKKKKKIPTEQQIEEKIRHNDKVLEINESDEKKLFKFVSVISAELKMLEKQSKVLHNDKCPTCGQDIPEDITLSLDTEISSKKEKLRDVKTQHSTKINESKEIKKKRKKLLQLERACDIARRDNEELEKSEGELDIVIDKAKGYNDEKVPLAKRITYLNVKVNHEQQQIKKYDESIQKIQELKKEIEHISEKQSLMEQKKQEYVELMNKNKLVILEKQKVVKEKSSKIKDMNDNIDYYKYIKDVCSDENAKSLAISKLRPLLVKETNTYLSDIGFNFYITLDDWLNATIKGPGITNGNYKSLSNGEKRTVDLALQNAFLSINRIQAGVLPDILIYDEVLDSSVDETSLSKIIEIIRNKEIEDNLKVFIISHRDNVAEMAEVDNIYNVVKSKGYSVVK